MSKQSFIPGSFLYLPGFFFLLLTACTSRFMPDTSVQLRLNQVQRINKRTVKLRFTDKNDSTRVVTTAYSKNYYRQIGHRFTLMYDSSQCKPCDSLNPAKGILKYNQ